MKTLETEIEIAAPVERVWQVLTDYERHPEWNPFIRSIKGDKHQGGKLTVYLGPKDGNAMTFKPDILRYDENKELRWRGKLGVRGIFDGEHYFVLQDMGNGHTRFIHGERFSGLLIPLVGKMLLKTKLHFERMNVALKAECEKA